MKQVAQVISTLITEVERLKSDLHQTEFTIHSYIMFNKDEGKFIKYMEKLVNEAREKDAKDRISDSLPDNR